MVAVTNARIFQLEEIRPPPVVMVADVALVIELNGIPGAMCRNEMSVDRENSLDIAPVGDMSRPPV